MHPQGTDQHTIIIGGGVIGVCCAYLLAKRGARVTVVERNEIGCGASFGNAGSIAPGHPPINKPGRMGPALRSLLDPLSPLHIVPRPDPALAHWFWKFSRACSESHLERAMAVLAPLGHATRALFEELVSNEKIECGFRQRGYYEIYLTRTGWEAAQREATLLNRYGFHPESVPAEVLRERDRSINADVVGGVFYPEAQAVNPYRFVTELAKQAARYGATFLTGTETVSIGHTNRKVAGIRTSGGDWLDAANVILAGGSYMGPLIRSLGLRLPLQPAKGYHCDCQPGAGRSPLLHLSCILGERMVFCTPMDGFVRFAGTLEFSGLNEQIRRPRLDQITAAAREYLNTMENAVILSEWCGLRPCLPDGLPAIGPVRKYSGLFVATGHAMMGLTLGPITGELIADLVLNGVTSLDIASLDPNRFS